MSLVFKPMTPVSALHGNAPSILAVTLSPRAPHTRLLPEGSAPGVAENSCNVGGAQWGRGKATGGILPAGPGPALASDASLCFSPSASPVASRLGMGSAKHGALQSGPQCGDTWVWRCFPFSHAAF